MFGKACLNYPKIKGFYFFPRKKEVSDEADILEADKLESFLHTNIYYNTIWDGQTFSKFPKQQVCNVFTVTQKRS